MKIKKFEELNMKISNKDLEDLASQIGGFIQYLEKKRKNKQFVIR